ncbi:HlyD family efflux transporter periplasmic adaptor subunit [Geitlerinema sp. PCC 9228]|uniref:HlyD family efflux transporter periplasmic adaptor subunit n=1 Tax=Geitlerinema sp. PCC 9228 TaxID=111611 RepID=UPI0008F9CFA3|nr:HlyD family efflux transporter periplasmic adaptor subunit [Geitlerinema sp. PCC 9228]
MTTQRKLPQTGTLIDQPVILERSRFWSRAFIYLIIGGVVSAVIWASVAKIDQAVPAQGKLEPKGAVKPVKAPVKGVVQKIHVENGQKVEKGDLLVSLKPRVARSEVESLRELRNSLMRENQVYDSALDGNSNNLNTNNAQITDAELNHLTQTRENLLAENQFLRAQLQGNIGTIKTINNSDFSRNQQQLVIASLSEYRSQIQSARLKIQGKQEELSQAGVELDAAKKRLQKLQERRQNAEQREETAREMMETNQEMVENIKPLVEQGAMSQMQLTRQQQEMLSSQNQVISARDEMNRTQSEIQSTQAEIERLQQEQQRLRYEISRFQEELNNAKAKFQKEIRTRIAENQKKIDEAEAQLSRSRLDNQQQLAQIQSRLASAEQDLEYQEIRSPVDGYVFNLKPTDEYVVDASETVVEIVPTEELVASVEISNQDIGFVEEGMKVDLNVASFPHTEFGVIEGELVEIGKNALPPDQQEGRQQYMFPAKVQLKQQSFPVGEERSIPLQSGMAVTAQIQVRERTVLSILTNAFLRKTSSFENVR